MKGKITLAILEKIGETVAESALLFEAILSAGYGASMGKIEYEASKLRSKRVKERGTRLDETRQWQRYYNIISSLKRDGLLSQEADGRFRLTLLGRKKLVLLKKRRAVGLPQITYPKQQSKNVIIVVFDVPERERVKRNWLRAALKNLGLKMVQQSVWLGKTKIPREFIDHIHDLRLTKCVEIFEV